MFGTRRCAQPAQARESVGEQQTFDHRFGFVGTRHIDAEIGGKRRPRLQSVGVEDPVTGDAEQPCRLRRAFRPIEARGDVSFDG
jgi:hypothetical protein